MVFDLRINKIFILILIIARITCHKILKESCWKKILLLFLFSIICSAQDIKIEGIISFDIKGNKYVSVQVNDTLKKFRDKAYKKNGMVIPN
jgi:Na+/serine symporter